jgi:hypothetical protein
MVRVGSSTDAVPPLATSIVLLLSGAIVVVVNPVELFDELVLAGSIDPTLSTDGVESVFE